MVGSTPTRFRQSPFFTRSRLMKLTPIRSLTPAPSAIKLIARTWRRSRACSIVSFRRFELQGIEGDLTRIQNIWLAGKSLGLETEPCRAFSSKISDSGWSTGCGRHGRACFPARGEGNGLARPGDVE